MLALRRLAAAQAHEARPLAAAFAGSSPHSASAASITLPSALTPSSGIALVSALPRSRSSSSSRGQHQRRHSSSKPSSPPNDDAITGTATTTNAAGSTGSTGSAKQTRKRERRKDAANKSTGATAGSSTSGKAKDRELPSAPSTEHLDSQAINLASFFSLHRPISVTLPVPSQTSAQSFASLFQPSTTSSSALQNRRVNETLFTLASAVRGFDKAIAQTQGQQTENFDMSDLRHAMAQSSNSHPDEGTGPVMYVSVHELARGMRPFVPPPPPEPVPTGSPFIQTNAEPVGSADRADHAIRSLLQSTALAALRGRQAEKRRNLGAVFAVRMRARRQGYLRRLLASTIAKAASVAIGPVETPARRGALPRTYQAISTRRRRYLKMKKHKFKKLQKLQKNEKRRQDRV